MLIEVSLSVAYTTAPNIRYRDPRKTALPAEGGLGPATPSESVSFFSNRKFTHAKPAPKAKPAPHFQPRQTKNARLPAPASIAMTRSIRATAFRYISSSEG